MARIKVFPEEIELGDVIRRFDLGAKFFESRVCTFFEVMDDPIKPEKLGKFLVKIRNKHTGERELLMLEPGLKFEVTRYYD